MRMIDTQSADWGRLRKHIEARIEEHKSRLVGLTDQTIIHRTQGRVMELQTLIEEVDPPNS